MLIEPANECYALALLFFRVYTVACVHCVLEVHVGIGPIKYCVVVMLEVACWLYALVVES